MTADTPNDLDPCVVEANEREAFLRRGKVEKHPGGCWIWHAGKAHGYGQYRIGNGHVAAHREAYRLWNSMIPPGALIRHVCDNPSCVNPSHLVAGSAQDNSDDRSIRGRAPSKLDPQDVIDIRRRLDAGESQYSIAKQYGVYPSTIRKIAIGQTWKFVMVP